MEFASSCPQTLNAELIFLLFVKKLLKLLLPESSLWCYSHKWKSRCLISLWAIAKLPSQGNNQCAGETGLSSRRTATSRILFIFLPLQHCATDGLRFLPKLHEVSRPLSPGESPHVNTCSKMLCVKEVLSDSQSQGAGVGMKKDQHAGSAS